MLIYPHLILRAFFIGFMAQLEPFNLPSLDTTFHVRGAQ